MQPLTSAPRSLFTDAQVTALLVAPDLHVDYGMELVNGSPNVVDPSSSSFEDGTVGLWSATAGGMISNSTTTASVGAHSLLATWPTGPAFTTQAVWTPGVALQVGAQYTFTVDVYVPSGNPPVALQENNTSYANPQVGQTSTVFDTWQTLELSFMSTATPSYLSVAPVTAATAGQVCSIDNLVGALGMYPPSATPEDISTVVDAVVVNHDNNAVIHGTVTASITQQLQWGLDMIRPYMLLSSQTAGMTGCRFNLGVYVLTEPDTVLSENPLTYAVTGQDQLVFLQNNVGDSYTVPLGTNVLNAVIVVLENSGVTSPVLLDTTAAAKTLNVPMSWVQSSSNTVTYLKIINDLLSCVGYVGLWCDWDGNFRSGPYVLPVNRPSEWLFDVGSLTTGQVAEARTVTNNVWQVPNWWRFVQSNLAAVPIEGTGWYTVKNQSTGPSSINALGGRVVRAPVQYLSAVTQSDLVTQGNAIVQKARQADEVITTKLSPFPLAWHLDRSTYADANLGSTREVICNSWSLPLNGTDGAYVMETI